MTDLPPPPRSRDLPPGVHTALRSRVLDATYEEAPSRRRRWLLPLAAAAAVLAVVFTAIGVLRAGDPRPGPVATHPASPSPSLLSTTPPPANPATFDPSWTRLTPGWLPTDYPLTSRYISRESEFMQLGGYAEPMIEISMSPRTARPPLAALKGDTTVPGPDVNGRPSTWSELAGTRRGWLRWEWADGAEVVIQLLGLPREGSAALAGRIAAGLHPQTPVRVAFPFTVTRPAYAWVIDSRVNRRSDSWVTSVRFGPSSGVLKETEVTWTPDVFVTNTYRDNATINSRGANIRTEGLDQVVRQVFDRNVGEVRCSPEPKAPAAEVRAECAKVAAGLTPFGDVKAPTSWNPDAVR